MTARGAHNLAEVAATILAAREIDRDDFYAAGPAFGLVTAVLHALEGTLVMERPFAMTTNATEREVERLTVERARLQKALNKATDFHDKATFAAQKASEEQAGEPFGKAYREAYEKLNGPARRRREAEASARLNAVSERLRNTRPSTVRGVLLKMKSHWYPSDREEIGIGSVFTSALADLERISGVSLDRADEQRNGETSGEDVATEQELASLAEECRRLLDRYEALHKEDPEGPEATKALEATLERIWDQRDQIIERLMSAQPDTVRGAMLKVRATWHPNDRKDFREQSPSGRMLVSALADLERLTEIDLDHAPEA